MDYVEGLPLDVYCDTHQLPIVQRLALFRTVCSAVQYAHHHQVIHRDLKPSNILVTADGVPKLLDFGIAKLLDPERSSATSTWTATGLRPMTPDYASPEQVCGAAITPGSDIYSLGVLLYELLTGHQPYHVQRYTPHEIERVICETEPERPSTVIRRVEEVPGPDGRTRIIRTPESVSANRSDQPERLRRRLAGDLDNIVLMALRKEPERRYASVAQFAEDIDRHLEGRPVRARKDTLWYRGTKFIKRNKAGVLTAALVAMILLLLAVGSSLVPGRGRINSIAVLPFANANADSNLEYLSDGITESLINSLSQLPDLKVMSRNSVFRYKERETDAQAVGQKLGVRAVLTGRVAQRGDGLAISIELVDARDNSQIWGQQYNRKLADVFAVQEEIAKDVSQKLRLKLTGTERQQLAKRPTENLKAFQHYMQGRAYSQRRAREDLLAAIRYYQKAIGEDRNYARAYAGLADAYVGLVLRGYIAPVEGRRKAEEAARKALALDENLADAHAALGQAYINFAPYNFSLGDRELRRAIELSPSLALGHQYLGLSLARQGRFDEALEEYLKARGLDPLSATIARQVALCYYLKRDYVRALEPQRQANELGPALSATWEIGVYIQNSLFDEALAELEKAKRERKNDPILIYSTGMVYAAQGKRPEALQIIKELEAMSGESPSQVHYIAKIYAALSEKERALRWLERGLAAGAVGSFYKDEPVWDTIRSDPRFADLLRRMGIPS